MSSCCYPMAMFVLSFQFQHFELNSVAGCHLYEKEKCVWFSGLTSTKDNLNIVCSYDTPLNSPVYIKQFVMFPGF